MANRQHFLRPVKFEIAKRATRPDGQMACEVDGCARPVAYAKLCYAHYRRKRLFGSPLAGGKEYVPKGERNKFVASAIEYKGDDCLLWPFSHNGTGYGIFNLDGKNAYAHRIVCESVNGPPPFAKAQAAHSCGNGRQGCITPNHLRWDSVKGNASDTVRMGRTRRGEHHGQSKLTNDQARYVLAMRGKKSCRALGAELGVAPSTVGAIWLGQIWAWL